MQATNRFPLLALGVILAGPVCADNSLLMTADTPVVNIERRSEEQNFLRLPTLQYGFTLKSVCADGLKPVSIQLSVADTRRTLRGGDIQGDENGDKDIELTLSIPQEQIAPVAIKGFCILPDEDLAETDARNEITIPAALSAQASLRCASETAEQIVYVSSALDVTLNCSEPAEEATTR